MPAELQGVPAATLQAWLAAAQTAAHQLRTGARVAEVSYSQGEGSRMVRYSAAKLPDLLAYIRELQAALGIGHGRRAMIPMFRGPL